MDSRAFWKKTNLWAQSTEEWKQSLMESLRRTGNPADMLGQTSDLKAVFMTSRGDDTIQLPGAVCEMTIKLAGVRFCEGSHRIATPEEIAAYQERMRSAELAIKADNARLLNSGRGAVLLTPITPTK